MSTDMRESRETRNALAADRGAIAVLRDSRRRVRMGSLKAALRLDLAISAIVELIEADHEYESARRDWDHVTAHDPEETSDETWRRVADRFEAAVMRRIAALRAVGGA